MKTILKYAPLDHINNYVNFNGLVLVSCTHGRWFEVVLEYLVNLLISVRASSLSLEYFKQL